MVVKSDIDDCIVVGCLMHAVQALREQTAHEEHNVQEEEGGAVGTAC